MTTTASEVLLSSEEEQAVLHARQESEGQPTKPWSQVKAELGLDE